MYSEASRPPNPSHGSTDVAAPAGSGGDPPPPAGAAPAATVQTIRPKEHGAPQPSTGGAAPESPSSHSRISGSLGVFQTVCHSTRRQSSGYFSFESDSLPNSPLSPRPGTADKADKATQTPSPAGQAVRAVQHALQRGAAAQPQHANPSDTRQRNAAEEMQAEAVGRQLRLMGDEYNRLLLLRGGAARHRQDVIPLNFMPHNHQEPAIVLCVSLLLLLIGRIVYLQGNNHDPQV
ncbi:bcl-2-like protein 11 [Cololabis saira]|uniref:bcl-2-like protein 11 n=1 Tax=Cololabis saira TaxID=129043 RepID=UPI002AD3CD77|nr:bcl-2-like protein 11 [Cololabis saira]